MDPAPAANTSTRSRRAHPTRATQTQLARLPLQLAHAKRSAPALAHAAARRRARGRHLARRAGARCRSRASRSSLSCRRRTGRSAGSARRRGERSSACSRRRVGSTSRRARARDYWRLARALFAAGFRAGDLVHNSFSYHFTPGGLDARNGRARARLRRVSRGTGQTEQQVQAMRDLRARRLRRHAVVPRIILEKADEHGRRRCRVSRRHSSRARRSSADTARYLADRGIAGFQVYARADLGSIAYESSARDGLVVDEGVIVEIVRPGTGDLVPAGEVGEVVVTPLYNADYPLVRFAHRRPVRAAARSPVAAPLRSHQRAHQGLDGPRRPDDQGARHVRSSVAGRGDAARHPEIARARLVVDRSRARIA